MSDKRKSKKSAAITIRSSAAEYLTYIAATGDNAASFEMRYEDENIWLTQKMMAEMYHVDVRTINYHIIKIFDDLELDTDSVIRNFRITAADGKTYDTKHYGLQMIIAVGFKVNSEQAVQFRKWVNGTAKENIRKKNPSRTPALSLKFQYGYIWRRKKKCRALWRVWIGFWPRPCARPSRKPPLKP